MAQPPILYQETRITPTPSSSSSILHINTSGSNRTSTLSNTRKRAFDEISGLDEDTYARKHLATEGSVFFRSVSRSPRSFLWRLLNDRKLLEVQCVDLVHKREHKNTDSYLTFRIEFKDSIALGQHGIAFADPLDVDALEIFVLTASNELLTITLKRDLLLRETVPVDFDASTCVKLYASSPLSFRSPYRLVAINSLELFVALPDGGLMKLERKSGESGAQWRETIFNEGGLMGTLRGLNPLKRRQTVKYGNLDLDPTTLAAIVKSPDGLYIWTVSLDHVIRAWSTRTWKVVLSMDLLNERHERDGQRSQKQQYVMDAEQGTLLQIIFISSPTDDGSLARMDEGDRYCIAVHSPKDHQFKIYQVDHQFSSVEGGDVPALRDLTQDTKLIPPIDELMNTNIWRLEQFFMHPGQDWRDSRLWLRARSGVLCKNFVLKFDLFDTNGELLDLTDFFKEEWSVVDPGSLTAEKLKEVAGYPGDLDLTDALVSPSEKWLAFLFFPGRFSTASLETALHVYRKGRGLSAASSSAKLNSVEPSLEERLTSSISSKITLHRTPDQQPDYVRYQRDIQAQWQILYSLLSHLQGRRHESVGLAFDSGDELPWSVCADFFAPIRSCSTFEMLCENAVILGNDNESELFQKIHESGGSERSGPLLLAARDFRRGLSAGFQDKLFQAAELEALKSADQENPDRIQALYDKCNFEMEVTDDDYDALGRAVEGLGGLAEIRDDPLAALEWIDTEGHARGTNDGRELARYGASFTVATSQSTLLHAQSVLLDLLTLVTFMAGGLEEDELHEEFRPFELYDAIMLRLKHNQLLLWVAGHVRPQSSAHGESGIKSTTILEDFAIGDWESLVERKHPRPLIELLTVWSKAWISGRDISKQWDGVTCDVMAHLIKQRNVDLAVDFRKFLTDHPWSQYLQARLHVATGDYALASIAFRECAEHMAELKISRFDAAELIGADEKASFGHGQSKYFEHVATIFEKLKVYSYTADFSQAALDHQENNEPAFRRSMRELDKKKSLQDSPALQKMDNTIEEIRILRLHQSRDDLLNRLFNAFLHTGRFESAFETLAKIDDPAPRRSNLKMLIESCVKQDAVPVLLALRFDEDLAADADKILLEIAQRTLASGSATRHAPYYQILYAFRSRRSDFRGAAEILYEHLSALRNTKSLAVQDPEDDTLVNAYVLLINTLACCGEGEGWMLVHGSEGKRRLVKLEDVRAEYCAELDKRSEIMQGRFPLFGAADGDEDGMDVL
ncbi:Hypothetical protein R9X50_00193200 [Acrodontium crateriforme]|uniref:Uncharacterized protein n=1 Tax=Acrodontium crateriforme TaxID=150365 RepID=A0AAQ3M1D5_9PEZI|nr:Hypothetical protein R9X50_00193200 [Acrodontium crateriforme]